MKKHIQRFLNLFEDKLCDPPVKLDCSFGSTNKSSLAENSVKSDYAGLASKVEQAVESSTELKLCSEWLVQNKYID